MWSVARSRIRRRKVKIGARQGSVGMYVCTIRGGESRTAVSRKAGRDLSPELILEYVKFRRSSASARC